MYLMTAELATCSLGLGFKAYLKGRPDWSRDWETLGDERNE